MTDRIEEQLTQAGVLLSEWREENLGDPNPSAPPIALVVPLPPARRPRRSVVFAAASVLLVGAVVAGALLANSEQQVPVATPGPTVPTGAPPADQLEGTMQLLLGDGQEIEAQVYADGSFCWGLPQQDESLVCGPSDAESYAGLSSEPSVGTVGTDSWGFLYGRLPDGATDVRVQLPADAPAPAGSTTEVVGDHWASSMLVPGKRVDVEYLNDAGEVVGMFAFEPP